MKKMVSLVCMLALLLGALGTTAFAAPQDDILAAVDANIPAGILQYYRTMGINILTQIDVTDAQAQEVSALIKQAGALLQEGTQSAHEYRAAQREAFGTLCANMRGTSSFLYNINQIIRTACGRCRDPSVLQWNANWGAGRRLYQADRCADTDE